MPTKADGKEFDIPYRPGGRRWAMHSQQSHTEGFLYSLSGHNSLANLSALLALKQRVGIEVFFVNT